MMRVWLVFLFAFISFHGYGCDGRLLMDVHGDTLTKAQANRLLYYELQAYPTDTQEIKELIMAGADTEWVRAFHRGVECNAYGLVKLLIDRGYKVNPESGRDGAPLVTAAASGRLQMIKLLVAHGADIKSPYNRNMFAASENSLEVMRYLLDNGMDVNQADKYGYTELMRLARHGHTEAAKMLIARGADVNLQNKDGKNALMLAIEYKDSAMAALLAESGTALETRDKAGMTALEISAGKDQFNITRMLLYHGAKVYPSKQFGECVLAAAMARGEVELVRTLLDKGAFFNSNLVLTSASGKNTLQILSLLKEKGADIGKVTDIYLCRAAWDKDLPLARFCIANGANINVRRYHTSPIHIAARLNDYKMTELLIAGGADVNIRGSEDGYKKMTALMFAAEFGSDSVVQLLEDHGADVNARNDRGMTALMFPGFQYSYAGTSPAILKILLDHGADINARDKKGNSAMTYQLEGRGSVKALEILADHGADLQQTDADGRTPLMAYLAIYYPEPEDTLLNKLIAKNTNWKHKDRSGKTAFDLGLKNDSKTARKMLQYGAPVYENTMQDIEKEEKQEAKYRKIMHADSLLKMTFEKKADKMDFSQVRNTLSQADTAMFPQTDALRYCFLGLRAAARFDSADIMNYILQKAPHAIDYPGYTVLDTAIKYNAVHAAALIISKFKKKGYDNINVPFTHAVQYNRAAIAKMLMDNGADVNTTVIYGIPPLTLAARNNDLEMAKMLIAKGAEVNHIAESLHPVYYTTPLLEAVRAKSYDMAYYLISSGADVNALRGTLILTAVKNDDIKIAALLLQHGANPNLSKRPGIKSLDQARNDTMKNLLLKYGALPGHHLKMEDVD